MPLVFAGVVLFIYFFCEPVKVAGEPFGGATDGLCSQQEKVTGHEFPVFHREKGKEDKEKAKGKKKKHFLGNK